VFPSPAPTFRPVPRLFRPLFRERKNRRSAEISARDQSNSAAAFAEVYFLVAELILRRDKNGTSARRSIHDRCG